jgi:prepilin signal peptidase PulO-like enzyme (type II secretory pathway)
MTAALGAGLAALVACCLGRLASQAAAEIYGVPYRSGTGAWWYAAAIACCACVASRHPVRAFELVPAIVAVAIGAGSDLASGFVFDLPLAFVAGAMAVRAVSFGDPMLLSIGAGATATPLLVLYLLSGGRAMGLGDVKLAAVIGAALGPVRGCVALWVALVLAGYAGALLLLCGRVRRGATMPFAPALAVGTWIAVLGAIA